MPTLTDILNQRQPLDVYRETAERLLNQHGYLEARRLCIQRRDLSTNGTATYAFHNAALKALERIHHDEQRQCG